MIGIRLLVAVIAYSVILLEVYSGVIRGPWWWMLPGGLVLALLIAMSIFGEQMTPSGDTVLKKSAGAGFVQWVVILGVAFAMSYFANEFGRTFIPDIMAGRTP